MTTIRDLSPLSVDYLLDLICNSSALIERLATIEHDERWSGWEKYRAEKVGRTHPSGEPYEERWKRLRERPYALLSEGDKESDRVEVRKTLDAIRAFVKDAEL